MKTQTIIAGLLISGASLFSSCGGNSTDAPTSTPTTSNPTSAPSKKKVPAIEFEETEFKYGEVTHGDTVSYSFRFTNTGDAPLQITNAKPSCGCTTPFFTKDPIMPGETGEIKAEFHSGKKTPGVQNKSITVSTNASDQDIQLWLKGEVIADSTETK